MRTRLRHAAWWLRDYAFVVRWQLAAVVGRDDTERLSSPGGPASPGVVLIPGVYESWRFLRPLATELNRYRYPVHLVDSLGFNTGPVPAMARRVADHLTQRDLTAVVIVAHSKGGLIGKYAMVHHDPDHRILAMVAVNTPFGGSRYARWIPLGAVQAFNPRDQTLAALSNDDAVNTRITSVSSRFDPHLPDGSRLVGALNVELTTPGHFRALSDPLLVPLILDTLHRAAATPVTRRPPHAP